MMALASTAGREGSVRTRVALLAAFGLALAVVFGASAGADQSSPQQPRQIPGAFRSSITLVPIDVRVLDRRGRPITDLTKDDFTVFEDKVPHEIQQFVRVAMIANPDPVERGDAAASEPAVLAPPVRRTFLLVLGRGRLQTPSRGLDGLLQFVRRLLPQDRLAVLAYNRGTAFTTDHARIIRLLEVYRERHVDIEARLAQHFSGLAAVYGAPQIPGRIQVDIDAVFVDSQLETRVMAAGSLRDIDRLAGDFRRTNEDILNADLITQGTEGFRDFLNLNAYSSGFDGYAESTTLTMQDLGRLYTGIEYLRYLEGEKHLVYLTARGLFLPRYEDDASIAAFANDARVTMNMLHTAASVRGGALPTWGTLPTAAVPNQRMGLGVPQMAPSYAPVQTSRTVAEYTGGLASAFLDPAMALTRLEAATRGGYIIGYVPSRTEPDGKYRRIEVKVNRPGATVLYRHGYYARDRLVPFDRKAFRTYSRITSAGAYAGEVRDIEVTAAASLVRGADGSRTVVTEMRIDPSRLALSLVDGRRKGSLAITVFVGDRRENLLGDAWETMDLNLSEATWQRLLDEGIRHTTRIAVQEAPRYAKVVVYDAAADLAGTAVAQVK
jgi:VWFA-related protein